MKNGSIIGVRSASPIQTKQLLNTKESALYIGLSKQTLAGDRCDSRYGIPFEKIGGRIYYSRQILDNFIAGSYNRNKAS